jgi:hypothetical protein
MSLDAFWDVIAQQLAELRTARTADDVIRILGHDRNPHGENAAGDGFFAGSGGDESVFEALAYHAGWTVVWYTAHYHYALRSPDGADVITYVEGDIYRGDGGAS